MGNPISRSKIAISGGIIQRRGPERAFSPFLPTSGHYLAVFRHCHGHAVLEFFLTLFKVGGAYKAINVRKSLIGSQRGPGSCINNAEIQFCAVLLVKNVQTRYLRKYCSTDKCKHYDIDYSAIKKVDHHKN